MPEALTGPAAANSTTAPARALGRARGKLFSYDPERVLEGSALAPVSFDAPRVPGHPAGTAHDAAASPSAAKLARQLTIADLTGSLELQAAVGDELPAGFMRLKSERELRAYLDGTLGVAYGIVERAELVAMALLRIPDERHPNTGPPFPLVPEADWPLSACLLESAMVRPAGRGRGFQRTLIDARLLRAASSRMRWACAGVALQNAASWVNLLGRGMAIAGMRFDPGYPVLGLLRSLDSTRLTTDPDEQVTVPVADAARHHAALLSGYVGVRRAPRGAVIYQRLRSPDAPGAA